MNTPTLTYHRVSTGKQEIDDQDSIIGPYLAMQGLSVSANFADPDTSGSIPMAKRKGGARLLEAMAALPKPFVVAVSRQDRLGRDTLDQVATIRLIWTLGGIPHLAAEGGAIPRTPQNELLIEVKASVAQYERNMTRSRIQDKLTLKAAAGEAVGHPPYGWDSEPGTTFNPKTKRLIARLVQNPSEQLWLVQILLWRGRSLAPEIIEAIEPRLSALRAGLPLLEPDLCDPGHGPGYIARRLNEMGVASKRGGRWSENTVAHLLGEGTGKVNRNLRPTVRRRIIRWLTEEQP